MTGPDLPATIGNGAVLSAVTPGGGLPYPVSSDPANQGANAIKALALALDPQYLELTGAGASQALPGNGWFQIPMTVIGASAGSAIIPSAAGGGVTFTQPGRYLIEGTLLHSANGTGRRGCGVHNFATGGPPALDSFTLISVNGNNNTSQIFYSRAWTALADTSAYIWTYVDAGVALTVTTRSMRVTRL
jgi:hypothetical protein